MPLFDLDYNDLVEIRATGEQGYISGLPCHSGPLYEVEISIQPPDFRLLPRDDIRLIRSAA